MMRDQVTGPAVFRRKKAGRLVVLSAIGLTSACVPARRAAAIDPCSAIRRV